MTEQTQRELARINQELTDQVQRLQRIEKSQKFQLELAYCLRAAFPAQDVVAQACRLLGVFLGVARVVFCEVDDAGNSFFVRIEWARQGMQSITGKNRTLNKFGSDNISQLRSGIVFACDDIATDVRTADYAAAYAKMDITASLAIPLVKAGKLITILNLQQDHPYHWTNEDIELARDMAERTWCAAACARAQEELRAERDQSRHVFENMTEGFGLLDAQWRVIQMNAEGLRIGQRDAVDVIGKNHWDVWPETIGTEVEAMYRRVKASGNSEITEQYVSLSDGHALWLEVRTDPALNGGLAIFFRDISERKRIDDNLRAIRLSSDNALIIAQLGTFDWTISTDRIECSERTRDIFSFGKKEGYIAADFFNRILPEDISRVANAVAAALADDGKLNIEYRIVLPNGDIRHIVSVSACQLGMEGAWERHIGVLDDVTERRQFEFTLQEKNAELLRAKTIAEKANLAKSEFLSSMSHELRTPLNAVLGFAQLLSLETPPPSGSQKLAIDQILHAGWYLLGLINEILDLATIEAGKISLLQESMSLTDVLQECEAMMEIQAQERKIVMNFPRIDVPTHVYADKVRVKQVLVNLLSNAIKYNREGGSITVQCVLCSDNRLRISVTDTGTGLAPELLPYLFQAFHRLGQDRGSIEGTGIGLVVTKQLVELMGGVIGVESKVGVGSQFWIELKVSDTPLLSSDLELLSSTEPDQTHVLIPTRKNKLILYFEENPADLAFVQQLIARRSDMQLLSATDAKTGIEMSHNHLPDVILMDINLPDINGFDALKILRDDPRTAHIPVIALSANAIARDIAPGITAGFRSYLTKPIKLDELMALLDLPPLHADANL